LVLVLLVSCPPVQGQQQRQGRHPEGLSDLASENLSRVAASAQQIEEVLRQEPGLLVELKRWVAKEVTDHGQILDDADLTEQGIFDRLSRDLQFRAVATQLLQRYGYLLPKPNPGSEVAMEQQFLLQERQRQLQKALAEEEKIANPERETRVAAPKKEGVRPVQPPPDFAPSPAPPRNPLEDLDLRSRPLLQATAGKPPGLSSHLTDSLVPAAAVSRTEDERSAMAAELRERGSTSPTPPESPTVKPGPPSPTSSPTDTREEQSALRPAILHRANPYADIPSLYDMYRQVSPRSPMLKRFGMDVFRNGTGDTSQLPMDLPVGPDYVVGPGDGLAIDLWGGISQRLYRIVDREGRLSLPEVGPVLVSGRTLGEVQSAVQQILRTQFRDVSADVSLSRLRTVRVYVVGDVEQPGAYDISSLSTPLNALFASGGPTPEGSLRTLRHYRGKQLVEEVDVYDLLLHGIRSDLKRLENGDTVLVPPMGPQVTVEGMVRRPATYELRGEKTLAEVLELAGGILPTATLRHIEVQRVVEHQKRTMLSLDISDVQGSEEVNRQLQSFAIRDGDEVRIFPIAPYNQDAVYLEGHVLRPGKYSFRPGMKLTDLVSAYPDLLPEPAAKYAEIVRLNPPDYRPSVESFDLAAALTKPAAAPKLQPLDTVRIFSRYDFENAPAVGVAGAVRNPGTYRTPGQIHLRDAIQIAGGLTPDALTENAQVYRQLPDSKLKIMSASLNEALAGNPIDNILLEPRDLILIHRNPARVDPPSVYIKGEVAKPGRYPLTTNMHVADLIRLAGGFKRSAYLETADLTRYLIQDKKQQVGEYPEIDIAAALAGDSNYNISLRDGDVLAIRQIPGWNDIGAAVSVRGEVQHPGGYGIRPGERLSSVLKRAGGFLPTAYPEGAAFERIEVRQYQKKVNRS
jgi:protein involved in polysaccharide export with SLBB domain